MRSDRSHLSVQVRGGCMDEPIFIRLVVNMYDYQLADPRIENGSLCALHNIFNRYCTLRKHHYDEEEDLTVRCQGLVGW